MTRLETFNGYRELSGGGSDGILGREYVAARVVGFGVSDGQFAGGRRGVDGQLSAGRQRLSVAGPACRRCRNTSNSRFDDELLSASERLWRFQFVVVADRRRS